MGSAMPIVIHCQCGRKMRVPDEYSGKRVKCPACGETQTVTVAAKDSLTDNWVNKAEADRLFKECDAIEHEVCPECGQPINYASDGGICGWECSVCDWGIWTSDPDADDLKSAGE
jgi:rRNA maturation protein Nop10